MKLLCLFVVCALFAHGAWAGGIVEGEMSAGTDAAKNWIVTYKLCNKKGAPITLLKSGTPLAPFQGQILDVKVKGGAKVPYEGQIARVAGGVAPESAFLSLETTGDRSCVTGSVDLSSAYSFKKDTTYVIEASYTVYLVKKDGAADVPSYLASYNIKPDAAEDAAWKAILAKDPLQKFSVVEPFELKSPPFELTIKEDLQFKPEDLEKKIEEAKPTGGADDPANPTVAAATDAPALPRKAGPPQFRSLSLDMKIHKKKRRTRARSHPKCSNEKKQALETAVTSAIVLIDKATQFLNSAPCHAKTVFTEYWKDASQVDTIKQNFAGAKAKLPDVALKCSTNAVIFGGCTANTIAYTYSSRGYNQLHICPLAFTRNDLDQTVIHEATHLHPMATDDLGTAYYERAGAKKAAVDKTAAVVAKQATNYEWFAKDCAWPCV